MNIAVMCKIVPDDQDIQVGKDRSLDFSKAHNVVSEYDLNAIEAAAQLAAKLEDAKVIGLSVGPKSIDDSKTKKGVIARGLDELILTADDALADADALQTAAELARMATAAQAQLIVAGDGSADIYAKQTGVQVAAALGLPYVSNVIALEVEGQVLKCTRTTETVSEIVEVPLPCVVAVAPEIAAPRIPGMKDILKAGKKPMVTETKGTDVSAAIEIVSTLAPKQADRKLEIFDVSNDGDVEKFVAAVKSAL